MTLCLDLGATNIRSAIVVKDKLKLYKKLRHNRKKQDILNKIKELISSYPKEQRKTICISTAGFEKNSKIQGAINMPEFNGTPLRKILKTKFKSKIFIENDANCAGLAELKYGNGKKFKNFVLLTLGSGIGGAVIINKKLYKGSGVASEPGSMFIEKGKIFEDLASGDASITLAKQHGLPVSSMHLENLAKHGNKQALEVYEEIGENLGIGMANLSFILDPEAFIIGGGFSRVKFFQEKAEKTLKTLYPNNNPKIIKAKFGDDAGLIGASLLSTLKNN
jgi:glucokinase